MGLDTQQDGLWCLGNNNNNKFDYTIQLQKSPSTVSTSFSLVLLYNHISDNEYIILFNYHNKNYCKNVTPFKFVET
jgi:hypothetical protein